MEHPRPSEELLALPATPLMQLRDGASPGFGGPRSDSRRALVAGLDDSSRKEASRWLSSAGFEVLMAAEAATAIDLYTRERPSVVLADMALRDEDRRTLCQNLREQANA